MIEALPPELLARICAQSISALICSTDGIGRPFLCLPRDVGRIRNRLKQANAEDLDSPRTDSPKPASKGMSIDFVSEVSEVWNRHRVSESVRMFAREIAFPKFDGFSQGHILARLHQRDRA